MPISIRPAVLWLLALLLPGAPLAARGDPFVFVSLPDTQIYSQNRDPSDERDPVVTDERGTAAIFLDQTQWIVDHAAHMEIRYVQHLGDIVQRGNNVDEWERAKTAMDLLLEADIPHGTVMGNHDDNDSSHGPHYRSNYLDYFGPQVFEGRSWYTASSPEGGASFQRLEHQGTQIGFLNFSIDHPQAEIDWATGIVADHPDTLFIVGTHRYLWDLKIAGGRYGEDVETDFGTVNLPANPIGAVEDPNDAESLYQNFLSQHPNILMVHAGHFHADWMRLDGQNSTGETIIQILSDYQNTRNGGDGFLRVYELDFLNGTLSFETWSPSLDRSRTTIDHFVESIFLVWDQRSSVAEDLEVDEETYLALVGLIFKDTDAPDGFLLDHPDFDTPAERAYYDQLLSDLFFGDIPEGFENILEWEGLWLRAFAANPDDPFDFSPGLHSPEGSVAVDFSKYAPIPEPTAPLLLAVGGLVMAMARPRRPRMQE